MMEPMRTTGCLAALGGGVMAVSGSIPPYIRRLAGVDLRHDQRSSYAV